MGTRPAPSEMDLYRRADEVLHYVWDPIGVAGVPEARDEYFGYLPTVLALLAEVAPVGKIAAYLEEVATVGMGLEGNPEHALNTAEVLLRWKSVIDAQAPNPSFKRTPEGSA